VGAKQATSGSEAVEESSKTIGAKVVVSIGVESGDWGRTEDDEKDSATRQHFIHLLDPDSGLPT
jgi:hypothetical protein